MIGDRLEEARKNRGISIREASEATKIRGEYLASMEDNSFEIALPEIYIRGFLKNYANFLGLNPDKVLVDYDAQQMGKNTKTQPPSNTDGEPRPQRTSLGRMSLHSTEDEEEDEPTQFTRDPEPSTPKKATPPPPTLENEGTSRNQENWADNKILYLKIGIVLAGVAVLASILFLLISLITRDQEPVEINPEVAQVESSSSSSATTNQSTSRTSTPASESITLTASDSVTVIVEQTMNRERLYSGTLNAGETIAIEKTGPVSIRFTSGSALLIEKGGREFRPDTAGVGRTVIE